MLVRAWRVSAVFVVYITPCSHSLLILPFHDKVIQPISSIPLFYSSIVRVLLNTFFRFSTNQVLYTPNELSFIICIMLSTSALGVLLALRIILQTLTEMSALPTTTATISTSTWLEKRQASDPNCNNSSGNCGHGNNNNNIVAPNNTTTSK